MKHKKKEKLSCDEHFNFAADLEKATRILGPWMQRFFDAYPVNGKECRELKNALRLLSSTICCTQDNHFFKLSEEERQDAKTPYYGKGKIAYI